MVADNRPQAAFRLCPDLGEENAKDQPLMRHTITADTCERRQDRGYHKCCRCIHQDASRAWQRIERLAIAAVHHQEI